jgi:hypothetical protein
MNKEASLKQAGHHLGDALDADADGLVTPCPRCHPEPRPPAAAGRARCGQRADPVLHLGGLPWSPIGTQPDSRAEPRAAFLAVQGRAHRDGGAQPSGDRHRQRPSRRLGPGGPTPRDQPRHERLGQSGQRRTARVRGSAHRRRRAVRLYLRRLRVFFALDFNGQLPGKARVEQQTDERIVIALSRLEPVGGKTLIGGLARIRPTSSCESPSATEPSSMPAPELPVPLWPSCAADPTDTGRIPPARAVLRDAQSNQQTRGSGS